ncbi:hypothetical protein [Breoghania sp.]|uniref:hypothetical protein n=1 Tax=Breoghania sp. TaxID=2065378 RepID=UPI0029CA3896|nr:hypothetical protein [Breoghania sp.]
MGVNFLSRTAYAVILGATLATPHTAFAFEPTGNPVADAFLTSLEAGYATKVSVESVAVAGEEVVMKGISADYSAKGDKRVFSIGSASLSDAALQADGSITSSSMALTNLSFLLDGDMVKVDVGAFKGLRIPSPEEIKNPSKAIEKPPFYREMEFTGITMSAEDEADVPIERFASTLNPIGDDGSIKASLDVEGILIDPNSVEDKDFAKQMAEMGYDSLNLSIKGAGMWSAADGKAALEDFEISGKDMGALHISTTLLGLTPEVLSQFQEAESDFGKLTGLLQMISIVDLNIHFRNDTMVDRILDMQAKEAGTDRAGLVDQLSGAMPNILALLQNPGLQEKIQNAAVAFLNQPGTFTVSANPAQPVPFGQIVGVAMIAPQTIPDMLAVEIQANQ